MEASLPGIKRFCLDRPQHQTSPMLLFTRKQKDLLAKSGPKDTADSRGGIQTCPKHWIAIVLRDEHDRPVAGAEYRIRLPSGEIRRGKLNPQGYAREMEIDSPGTCRIDFPDFDYVAYVRNSTGY